METAAPVAECDRSRRRVFFIVKSSGGWGNKSYCNVVNITILIRFSKQMQRIIWCNGNTCCSANYNIRRCWFRYRLIALLTDNQLFPLHNRNVPSFRRQSLARKRPDGARRLKLLAGRRRASVGGRCRSALPRSRCRGRRSPAPGPPCRWRSPGGRR